MKDLILRHKKIIDDGYLDDGVYLLLCELYDKLSEEQYDEVNTFLIDSVPIIDTIMTESILAILTITSNYKEHLSFREEFYLISKKHLRKNYTKDYTKRLLQGLK